MNGGAPDMALNPHDIETSRDQPVSLRSVGDLTRVLVLLDEANGMRKLTTPELEALCHLVATERDEHGHAKWPLLRFAYRFQFSQIGRAHV